MLTGAAWLDYILVFWHFTSRERTRTKPSCLTTCQALRRAESSFVQRRRQAWNQSSLAFPGEKKEKERKKAP